MTHRLRTDGLKEKEHSRTQSRDAVLGLFPQAFSCPSSHPEILLLLPSKQEGGGNLHRLADWREKGQISPHWEGVGLWKSVVKQRSLGRSRGPQELLLSLKVMLTNKTK